MNKNVLKIVSALLALLLFAALTLGVIGYIPYIYFWVLAAITGFYAFFVLPKINKNKS